MRGILGSLLAGAFLACSYTIPAHTVPIEPGASTLLEIACPEYQSNPLMAFAAREVRRYVYLTSGEYASIISELEGPSAPNRITLLNKRWMADMTLNMVDIINVDLKPGEYVLNSNTIAGHRVLMLTGGDELGVLYAAYRFAELLGVRFYLHGDVLPDAKKPFQLPQVDSTREVHRPLFALRGIQPFHDFPEGPDWWGSDQYQAVIAQLPKMGMNFIGLHTYPLAEPTVWVGEAAMVNDDGTVKKSYPTQYFNTGQNSSWAFKARPTSKFACGAAMLFEDDNYGADYLRDMMPAPTTEEQNNAVFNRTGAVLRGAFARANRLGVKTCIGTETPLRIPPYILENALSPDSPILPLGGANAFYNTPIDNTEDDALYQSVRYNLDGYNFKAPNGTYTVTLKFCEVAYDQPGVRVFDVSINGEKVLDKLDIFAQAGKNTAFDRTFEGIIVSDGMLKIQFGRVVELPAIAAIAIEGNGVSIKVNCGGDAYKDWKADAGVAADPALIQRVYEGIFTRLQKACPVDYYWFWTPEDWTWSGTTEVQAQRTTDDLLAAYAARKQVAGAFGLATSGWVLGPQFDRTYLDKVLPKDVSIGCINRQLGFEPVDKGFASVTGRGEWAIPWLEDDPAMSIPQFWARRMRRDAQSAREYGCNGLMGIHWRTRNVAPTLASLARAAWNQQWPKPEAPKNTHRLRDTEAGFPINTAYIEKSVKGADKDLMPVYQTARLDAKAYRIQVPNGVYQVTLRFCEPSYHEAGKRVFSLDIEGAEAVKDLDLAAEAGLNTALDKVFGNIHVEDGLLEIALKKKIDFPCVSAIEVEGQDTQIRINCGGGAWKDFGPDAPMVSEDPDVSDFYRDWAEHEFGPEAAGDAAAIFTALDGCTPRPATWTDGPGAFNPDPRPWDLAKDEYAFVGQFEELRKKVQGKGNQARFDYWCNSLAFLREAGRMNCAWAAFNRAMDDAKTEPSPARIKRAAKEEALPARIELVKAAEAAYDRLLAMAGTAGELGNIANLEGHTFPKMLDKPGGELENMLDQPLPKKAQLRTRYAGPSRLFLLGAPTNRGFGEGVNVKAVLLSESDAEEVTVNWRVLGADSFWKQPLENKGRGVWGGGLAAAQLGTTDIEYYVEALFGDGAAVQWPPTAPGVNHSVVVGP